MVHVFLTTSQHPLYCGTYPLNYQSTTLVLWCMFSPLPINIPCIVVHVFVTTSQHPLYCCTSFLTYQSTSFVLWYMFSYLPINILWYCGTCYSQLLVNILFIVVHVFLTTSQHPLYCGTWFLNYQSTYFVLRYMFS